MSDAAAPAERTWFEEPPSFSAMVMQPNQVPSIRLRPKLQLYTYRADKKPTTPTEKFLLVNLDGSTASPGTLAFDRKDKRGWFTELVSVKVWFPKQGAIVIRQDQPQTSKEDGSMSNSIGVSFSGGFFGNTATGSAGASISSSISQSIPDFVLTNRSTDTVVRHEYALGLVAGHKYGSPLSLIGGKFGELLELPPRAVSNLPLVSQVLFHAPRGLDENAVLHIEVTHRLVQVEKTFSPSLSPRQPIPYDPKRRNERQRCVIGDLDIRVDPAITSNTWEYEIPFGDV